MESVQSLCQNKWVYCVKRSNLYCTRCSSDSLEIAKIFQETDLNVFRLEEVERRYEERKGISADGYKYYSNNVKRYFNKPQPKIDELENVEKRVRNLKIWTYRHSGRGSADFESNKKIFLKKERKKKSWVSGDV